MAKAYKLLDPITGTITAYDCLTGQPLTAEQLAASTACLEPRAELSDACIQPLGNTDPALIEPGYCLTVLSIDAVTNMATVENVQVLDSTKADVTATHEVTRCPEALIPVGEVCYTA